MSHPPQNNWPPQGGSQQGWQPAQQWGGGGQAPYGAPQGGPAGPPPGFGGPQPQWTPPPGGKPAGGSKLPWILMAASAVGILLVLAIVFLGDGSGSGEAPAGGQTQQGGDGGAGTEGDGGTQDGGADGGGSDGGGVQPQDPGKERGGGDWAGPTTPALPDSFGSWSRNTSTEGVSMGEPYTDGSRNIDVLHESAGGNTEPPGAPGAGEWSHGPGVLCLASSESADALQQCVIGYADGGVVVFMSTDRSAVDDAVPAFLAATR